MKVAIAGTESTGKSTLAEAVGKRYGVPVIPEFAREVSSELKILKPRDMLPEQALLFQNRILQKKIEEENKHESFIADRSTADNMAYYLRWCARGLHDSYSSAYVTICTKQIKTYDMIVILPWGIIPHQADGFRSSKLYYSYEIHCLIIGILQDLKVPYEMLEEPNFEKRVKYFEKFFRCSEKERKHGFPCGLCGAKNFEEAGNLCRGEPECPGDTMSKEVFNSIP